MYLVKGLGLVGIGECTVNRQKNLFKVSKISCCQDTAQRSYVPATESELGTELPVA